MGWFDEQQIQTAAPAATGGDPYAEGAGQPAQDPRAYFQSLFPGSTLSPEQLVSKEAELQAAGIRILGPNARGQRTKIELPNGQIVDVIGGAGAGTNRNQWLVDSGGGAGEGTMVGNYGMGTFTGGGRYPLASVMGPGLMQPWMTPFDAPDPNQIREDPSYKFQMQEGLQALQRSAAAKGTLLTGGTLKDMNEWAQGLASTFDDKYYNRALGEYNLAYGIYDRNQANQFGRMGQLANLGQQAATGYGLSQAGLTQDVGNATAAGQAGSANAWGTGIGNVGSTIGGAVMAYPWYTTPQPSGMTGFRSPIGQNVDPNQMFR